MIGFYKMDLYMTLKSSFIGVVETQACLKEKGRVLLERREKAGGACQLKAGVFRMRSAPAFLEK